MEFSTVVKINVTRYQDGLKCTNIPLVEKKQVAGSLILFIKM